MATEWKILNPLARNPVETPLDVGVRAINSLLTIGKGQRVGIVNRVRSRQVCLARNDVQIYQAEIVVVGLIGERGREVGSFVKNILSGNAKSKTIVVAVPADRSPLLRIRGLIERPP